ncbi:unnamed protein product, partial [Ectocarpus sp. 6 AP-2014]
TPRSRTGLSIQTLANDLANPTFANEPANPTLANDLANPTYANGPVNLTFANELADPSFVNEPWQSHVRERPGNASLTTKPDNHIAGNEFVKPFFCQRGCRGW